jgi:benzodiazapine receptor
MRLTDSRPIAEGASLIGWLGLAFIAAGVGAIASADAGVFYRALSRPEWAPPASVFGPVWTVLYALMGVAAWLVWRKRHEQPIRLALLLFVVQLFVNGLWSWLFFAWHHGALAFVDIVALLILLMATIATFWRVSRLAAALLLPYLAWVSFATALNWAVWQLNPAVL